MEVLLIIAGLLMIVGVIGSIIPALPGPALGFAGLAILYLAKGGAVMPLSTLIIFGIVMGLLLIFSYVAPVWGARYSGATKRGIWGAALGALIGIILFMPLGIFIGAFFGALMGELSTGKEFSAAAKAGVGTLLGSVMVVILQTIFSIVMAVYFFWKVASSLGLTSTVV